MINYVVTSLCTLLIAELHLDPILYWNCPNPQVQWNKYLNQNLFSMTELFSTARFFLFFPCYLPQHSSVPSTVSYLMTTNQAYDINKASNIAELVEASRLFKKEEVDNETLRIYCVPCRSKYGLQGKVDKGTR